MPYFIKKIIKRYQNYDYSSYHNSEIIYRNILEKLNNYELNNQGRLSVIHGDPVFSNIIINLYGKIKFIDMRGKLGDNLSSDISAKFENGVLRIEIPKREKEESTKRSINIY